MTEGEGGRDIHAPIDFSFLYFKRTTRHFKKILHKLSLVLSIFFKMLLADSLTNISDLSSFRP